MQAEVPQNSTTLLNKIGTAPGMWFEVDGTVYVSMPGVPMEMKYLMTNEVIPRLKQRFTTPFILHTTLLTQGIGESFLSDRLEEFEAKLPEAFKLAYLPAAGSVRLRLSARGEENAIRKEMDRLVQELSAEVAEYLYGYGEDTIQELLGKALLARGWTVATAESCSGGYAAHLITSVSGSSAYYIGSTVTYSNESKTKMLGVTEEMLREYGAVSEPVVLQMANAVKEIYGTDCSISISGIAGPSGGSEEKPVGTVWMGISVPGKTIAKKVRLGKNRLATIEVASMTALNMLRKMILE
jgi:nicotinamide-nucleotide amidase